VQAVVHPGAAERGPSDHQSAIGLLLRTGDDALSMRVMTPSVIMPVWKPRSAWPDNDSSTAFGKRSDAHLQRVAIVDETRDMIGDGSLDGVRRARRRLAQRTIGLDRGRESTERQSLSADRAGHPVVDLGDQCPGVVERVGDVLDADAQRDQPVLVGWRDLEQADVAGQSPSGEHARRAE